MDVVECVVKVISVVMEMLTYKHIRSVKNYQNRNKYSGVIESNFFHLLNIFAKSQKGTKNFAAEYHKKPSLVKSIFIATLRIRKKCVNHQNYRYRLGQKQTRISMYIIREEYTAQKQVCAAEATIVFYKCCYKASNVVRFEGHLLRHRCLMNFNFCFSH